MKQKDEVLFHFFYCLLFQTLSPRYKIAITKRGYIRSIFGAYSNYTRYLFSRYRINTEFYLKKTCF